MEPKCGGCNDCVYCKAALPEGKTCSDCYAFKRFCEPVIGVDPGNTWCDWIPSRFAPPIPKEKETA